MHPFVKEAILLEHGCEHTHNGLMRDVLKKHGIDPARFGYASIQLDGGIEKVVAKIEGWFAERLDFEAPAERCAVGLEILSLGIVSSRPVPATIANALAEIVATIVSSGGTVVIPDNTTLLDSPDFPESLALDPSVEPSLDYGQVAGQAGLHVMAAPTGHVVETLTGLGGTGVQVILAYVGDTPVQGHPMIPLLQITSDAATDRDFWPDMDYVIPSQEKVSGVVAERFLSLVCDTASQSYQPKLWAAGNTDFQFTRGMLGVSL
jgi:altronate dehydratase